MERFLIVIFFLFLGQIAYSQVDPETLSSINYKTVERLEIKSGSLKNGLNYTMRPMLRRDITNFALYIDTATTFLLTEQDQYNLQHIFLDNNDLIPENMVTYSAKPILKQLYKTPAHFYQYDNKDVSFTIDPIFYGNLSYDKEILNKHGYINTRGVYARATIDKWLSLYTSLTENQVRLPSFVHQKADSLKAVPGIGFYRRFKNNNDYDYFEPRGGISLDLSKHVGIQLAYDKHFIGDGYRSLFTSENSSANTFLNFNFNFWKINYTNLYEELNSTSTDGPDTLVGKKYKVSHHLSYDANDWLNIGFYETIIFARQNQFEFNYLNPIIFYRAIEQQVGSPDNSLVGFNYSALVKKRVKLYGQIILDEFRSADLFSNNNSWANKFGIQQGALYVDAFGVNNLDLQGEFNRTRPYTYAHNNLISAYTSDGQAIAHPLGANFNEFVGIVNYQPIDKLRLNATATYARYGRDPDSLSWGGEIIKKTYRNRPFDNGVKVGQGILNHSLNLQGRASYELKYNLNLDLQGVYKTHHIDNAPTQNELYAGASIRWNFGAYDYNY